MSIDAYAPCPCGSGKKVKFCCLDILSDLTKFHELRKEGQSRAAMQLIEKLERAHPRNSWVALQKAIALLDEGQLDEARTIVDRVLKEESPHPFSYMLKALVALRSNDPDLDRFVEEAFEHPVPEFLDELVMLAQERAFSVMDNGHPMAARQYLQLGMALAVAMGDPQEEIVQAAAGSLMGFDRQKSVPFPLRNLYMFREPSQAVTSLPEYQAAIEKSHNIAGRRSAELFTQLAEKHPQESALHFNAGLCWAWAGEDDRAAWCFRQAAKREADFETAVEMETLAQLLYYGHSKNQVKSRSYRYEVDSVGRLLTSIDANVHYQRQEHPDRDLQTEGVAGVFDIVTAPKQPGGAASLDSVGEIIGLLLVNAAAEGKPAEAYLELFPGTDVEGERRDFEQVAGADAKFQEEVPGEAFFASELLEMRFNMHFPREMRPPERRKVIKLKWDHCLSEVWPNIPMAALGGKSPLQVAGVEALRIPLAAALNVLDAYCDSRNYPLTEINDLRGRLKLPEPQPIEVKDDTDLRFCSLLEMRRLRLYELSEEQFGQILQRGVRSGYALLVYDLLTEALARAKSTEEGDTTPIYSGLSDLSMLRNNREEALAWIAKGRENSRKLKHAFQQLMYWDVKELTIRMEDPKDPQVATLGSHLWNYYGAKVPRIREDLDVLFTSAGITPPWRQGVMGGVQLEGVGSGTVGSSGLWTPGEAPAESGSGGSKLWLPGQE